jgi:hypothetical protein
MAFGQARLKTFDKQGNGSSNPHTTTCSTGRQVLILDGRPVRANLRLPRKQSLEAR